MAKKKPGTKKAPGEKQPENATSAAPAPAAPKLRDRIKELRRVPASELLADPRNWHKHPEAQRSACAALFAEIGIANACLAREDEQGKLVLIDGHMRTDVAGDAMFPVLILDVTEDEAAKLLATLDPLGMMAEIDEGALKALMAGLTFETPDVDGLLASIDKLVAGPAAEPAASIPAASKTDAEAADGQSAAAPGRPASTRYAVLIDCTDEMQQTELLDRFDQEGLKCRALVV